MTNSAHKLSDDTLIQPINSIDCLVEISHAFCHYFSSDLKVPQASLQQVFLPELTPKEFTKNYKQLFARIPESKQASQGDKLQYAYRIFYALLQNKAAMNTINNKSKQFADRIDAQLQLLQALENPSHNTTLQNNNAQIFSAAKLLLDNYNLATLQETQKIFNEVRQNLDEFRRDVRHQMNTLKQDVAQNDTLYNQLLDELSEHYQTISIRYCVEAILEAHNNVEKSFFSRTWHKKVIPEIIRNTHSEKSFVLKNSELHCHYPQNHRLHYQAQFSQTLDALQQYQQTMISDARKTSKDLLGAIDNTLTKEQELRDILFSDQFANHIKLTERFQAIDALFRNLPEAPHDITVDEKLYRKYYLKTFFNFRAIQDDINEIKAGLVKIFNEFANISAEEYAPKLGNSLAFINLSAFNASLANRIEIVEEHYQHLHECDLEAFMPIQRTASETTEASSESSEKTESTENLYTAQGNSADSNEKRYDTKQSIENKKETTKTKDSRFSATAIWEYVKKHPIKVTLLFLSTGLMVSAGITAVASAAALSTVITPIAILAPTISTTLLAHHLAVGLIAFTASATTNCATMYSISKDCSTSQLLPQMGGAASLNDPKGMNAANDLPLEELGVLAMQHAHGSIITTAQEQKIEAVKTDALMQQSFVGN